MQIERKVERLCGAKPAAFLVGLYPVVQELVSFVNGECEREPENSEEVFAVLARSIARIYARIDRGGDIIDCELRRPTVPDGRNRSYSYRAVTAKMRRLRKPRSGLTAKRARRSLSERFRECTWLFSFAYGKDWENRWDLLLLYNDLIADMWGCAKELCGKSATS